MEAIAGAEDWLARRNWAAWFLVFTASALVLALRAPDSLVHPQFWAEDGSVFFADQLHHGAPRLFLPYAGYLLLIPRAVAWIASAFSAFYAPAIYSYSALLIGAASIASLREMRLGLGGFAFLLAPFALTPTNGEVFGTLTNVQWFTQFYEIVVVSRFIDGRPPANTWRAGAATILAGLTGPFCVFASAAAAIGWLWIWRVGQRGASSPWSRLRSPAAYGVGILMLCSFVQLWVMRNGAEDTHATFAQWIGGVDIMFAALQSHFFGHRLMWDSVFLAIVTIVVAASLIWIPLAGGDRATLACILVFVLAGFLAAGIKAHNPALIWTEIVFGDRYFFATKIFIWWCVAAALALILRRGPGVRLATLTLLLGASVVYANSSLQRAPMQNKNWGQFARQIDNGEAVTVPINPNWQMSLPARKPPSFEQ